MTTPGRRTGRPRSTCVRYSETPDGFVVWGTGSGSRRDPDWFEDLRRSPTARVQIRERDLDVRTRELQGAERDVAWRDTILAQARGVSRYTDGARSDRAPSAYRWCDVLISGARAVRS